MKFNLRGLDITHEKQQIKEILEFCFSGFLIRIVCDCFSKNEPSMDYIQTTDESKNIYLKSLTFKEEYYGHFCDTEKYEYRFSMDQRNLNPFHAHSKKRRKVSTAKDTIPENKKVSNQKITRTSYPFSKNKESYSNLFYYANENSVIIN